MTSRIAPHWMLLAAAGTLAVAGPIALGIGTLLARAQYPQTPPFEVVSVKPYEPLNPGKGGDLQGPAFLLGGRFTSKTPLMVIAFAYDVPFFCPTPNLGPAMDQFF